MHVLPARMTSPRSTRSMNPDFTVISISVVRPPKPGDTNVVSPEGAQAMRYFRVK